MFKSTNVTVFILCLLTAGCASNSSGNMQSTESVNPGNGPSWLYSPPKEEGYFFGIGCDPDMSEAKEKAFVSIARQFKTTVVSALSTENTFSSSGKEEQILTRVDHQLTDIRVAGAKIFDSYTDSADVCWILVKAPANCSLDMAEGVLLSYSLEQAIAPEALISVIDTVETVITNETDTWYHDKEFSWDMVIVPDGVIKIDGNLADWTFGPQALAMLNEDISPERDINKVYLAKDTENIYIRVDFRGGKPRADSADITYDLVFNINGYHYELWCLKNKQPATVNILKLQGDGWTLDHTSQKNITRGCQTSVGEGFLEARFPLSAIKGDSTAPVIIQADFRVRDGGARQYDKTRLPDLKL